MTDIENYHNWLRDAHAMEKQAEVILIAAIRRSVKRLIFIYPFSLIFQDFTSS